jgi:hypothetical protein
MTYDEWYDQATPTERGEALWKESPSIVARARVVAALRVAEKPIRDEVRRIADSIIRHIRP